jgi:predicted nuclease of restriction endonuclease-like RecB superfamily
VYHDRACVEYIIQTQEWEIAAKIRLTGPFYSSDYSKSIGYVSSYSDTSYAEAYLIMRDVVPFVQQG